MLGAPGERTSMSTQGVAGRFNGAANRIHDLIPMPWSQIEEPGPATPMHAFSLCAITADKARDRNATRQCD